MVVGNAAALSALRTLKSNLDSGIPRAIQYMANEALTGPQNAIGEHNAVYQRRRDLICETLTRIGLQVYIPKASLYIWAKVPEGYNSIDFTSDLLEQVGIAVTPGVGYGAGGEGYVRLSMTLSDVALVKGLSRLSGWRNKRHLTMKKIT
jgi:LL-diaminopimelate aminotransferase